MKSLRGRLILLVLAINICSVHAQGGLERVLAGWGIPGSDVEQFMAQADDVGFDVLITGSRNLDFVRRAVEVARPYGLEIYACITPMGHVQHLWEDACPDRPIPWQVLTEEQEAARSFIGAGRNMYMIPYQFGGEPVLTNEVLTNNTVCFSDPEAKALLMSLIDEIAAIPDLTGLAFDGFGYQNFHRCHCERCEKLLQDHLAAYPETDVVAETNAFFRDMLVGYINELADYTRSRRAEMKTTIHIWPAFAPEPLYGNRLDVDFCGQTAAWYMLWPEEKIAEYSRSIVEDAQKYHGRQQGVGMIGYYDRPGEFPVKDAARVEMELSTMIANGCRRIQVCSSVHVVRNEAIADVFRRHFSR